MRQILLTLFFLALTIFSTFSQAKPPKAYTADNDQSLSHAVKKVKKRTGGRVLSADTIDKNGHQLHRIKVLLPNGKVRIVKINTE